jgi:hypothetical protein
MNIIRAGAPKDPDSIYLRASFFRAAAARNVLKDFYLFAGTGVLDKMADVDDAVEELAKLAAEAGLTLIQLAIGFAQSHPAITSPLLVLNFC